MGKITKPEEVFPAITEDYKKVFGNDLVSLILYGSGAGADYRPGKSDLNFLIVLSEGAIDRLDEALDTVSRWRKKSVATPLFMTVSYITSSLDSFPLEFLTMKRRYIVVHGEDVLRDIAIGVENLRLQCEREIKGKLLLLRKGFLETEGKTKRIKELISASITAFLSIFIGLLFLKNSIVPETRREIIQTVSKEFSLDETIFMKCLDIKEGEKAFSSSEIHDIFKQYLTEVRTLWGHVDTIEL